ncbi:MAG: 4-(cytidine 5'-diphospho)-2-C-methyl-D-erythritol kinase [Acidimicrobiales bacterium]
MTTLEAPAKLTWSLAVRARRDDGYHVLRAEMVTLGLRDALHVHQGGTGVRFTGPYGASVDRGPGELVGRALALVGRAAGVTVDKQIPVGGGLGGGSADAAAILRWAGGVDPATALTLGADVPFCQMGGRARVEGIGEELTPLPWVERDVTLLVPDFAVSTAACYQAFDEMVAAGWRATGRNHLEEPARRVEPRLAATLDWLRARYGEVHLAGSGSTLYVEGHLESPEVLTGPAGPVRVVVTATAR